MNKLEKIIERAFELLAFSIVAYIVAGVFVVMPALLMGAFNNMTEHEVYAWKFVSFIFNVLIVTAYLKYINADEE
jgi:uncharacterized protein YqhQ